MDWKPIASAPTDGTIILTCKRAEHGPPWHFYAARFNAKQNCWSMFYTNMKVDPTHWQHMPVPPNE